MSLVASGKSKTISENKTMITIPSTEKNRELRIGFSYESQPTELPRMGRPAAKSSIDKATAFIAEGSHEVGLNILGTATVRRHVNDAPNRYKARKIALARALQVACPDKAEREAVWNYLITQSDLRLWTKS